MLLGSLGADLYCLGSSVFEVHALVKGEVHGLEKHAISWNSHAGFYQNYVSNDKVENLDWLGETVLASDNADLLVSDGVVELEVLLAFEVVARGLEEGDQSDGEVNRRAFNPF